jgi:DeoR/GlpR family transcriptional regulator of sugar metabolism
MNGSSDGHTAVRERRQAILDVILERDTVTVRELTERFSVSTMTVHRDLDALEDRGVLRKVRGGATAQPTALYESSLPFRFAEMREAKERIAQVAAARVEPGSSLVLDDSTTGLAMLPHLADLAQLTLVTNFVSIVEEVSRMTDSSIRLISVGGTYNPKYHAFGGVLAEEALRDLHVDRCFVSVAAVDTRRGAFHQDPDQAAIKRMMIEIADESTLLVDSSKFTKSALHRVVELEAFDVAILEEGVDEAVVSSLRSCGLEVILAGAPSALGSDGSGE